MKTNNLLVLIILLTACTASPATETPAPSIAIPTETISSSPTQPQTLATASPAATSVPAAEPVAYAVPQPPGAGEKLVFESIDMIDPNLGWGIDNFGRIFHAGNGGETWALSSPPDGVYTGNGFFALDGLTAWAAKDVPIRCWDYWALYQCSQPYYAAVKSGQVWKTSDGGKTWQPSQPFSLNVEKAIYNFDGALPFSPVGLQFVDPQTGWLLVTVGRTPAGEQSLLYRTDDGGATWKLLKVPRFEATAYSCRQRGFGFTDQDSGWLISDCVDKDLLYHPQFLRTKDRGENWLPVTQLQPLVVPPELQGNDVNGSLTFSYPLGGEHYRRFSDDSLGVQLVQNFPNSHDEIVVFFRFINDAVFSKISGVDFYRPATSQHPAGKGGWQTMDSEYFWDSNLGWRLYWDLSTGGRSLQKTTNGGQKWESIKSVTWTMVRFEFVDAQTGWAIVTGQAGLPVLVKTTDGGQTWAEVAARALGAETSADKIPSTAALSDSQPVDIAELWMIDSTTGWAVTVDNQVARTTDGAQSWSKVTPPADYKAYNNKCFNYDNFWMNSGGLTPNGFFALDANKAWVAQNSCSAEPAKVWKTTDGGQTWKSAPFTIPVSASSYAPPFLLPISLSFVDPAHGWLVINLYVEHRSLDAYLFQTQDGGDTWDLASANQLDCFPTCTGMAFSDPFNGWLADDPRSSPLDSPTLKLNSSSDGGKIWEPKLPAGNTPPLPANPIYTARVGKLDWGPTPQCGTPEMRKFPNGRIGAFSNCRSSYSTVPFFAVDYLALIDKNTGPNVKINGVIAMAQYGGFEVSGGWTTSQSEFFYDDRLGWRLYSGVNVDADGPSYLQRTQDGGETWENVAPVPWQSARFQFVDPQNGWASVTLSWGKALVHTADGGGTWEELKPLLLP